MYTFTLQARYAATGFTLNTVDTTLDSAEIFCLSNISSEDAVDTTEMSKDPQCLPPTAGDLSILCPGEHPEAPGSRLHLQNDETEI